MLRAVVVILLVSLLILESFQASVKVDAGGIRQRRAVDSHDHGGEDGDSDECAIARSQLMEAFNEVAVELNFTGLDDLPCSLHVPECHHHEEEEEGHHDDEEEGHHDDEEGHEDEDHHKENGSGEGIGNSSVCVSAYAMCQELIVHAGLVPATCLAMDCPEEEHPPGPGDSRPTAAQAYGLGFLMIVFVCLASVLGIFIVPLVYRKDKNETAALVYKYMYVFMIALGTSALVSDAILHLFPHAWELHAHEEEEGVEDDGHAHSEDEDGGHGHGKGVEEFIWKGALALLAIYLFFMLEYLLHGLMTSHTHPHGFPTDVEKDREAKGKESIQLDDGVPHAEYAGTKENAAVGHPGTATPPPAESSRSDTALSQEPLVNGRSTKKEQEEEEKEKKGILGWLRQIKPLAWLIIIGDGFHNFADGLALGAAISGSLTLGVSTTIALVLHELPHEFGDYVILLSTGLTWYSALIFNFISSLTAILGFFIGVGVGTESEEATLWILAFAAGLFIYIALVDLLPELIHIKDRGRHRWGLLLMANLGFFLSFLVLFLLAVYEEPLNDSL